MSAAWAQPARPWSSGRWSAELRDDEIADLAVDGEVVLRSVRAVVRDHDWDTAALVVDGLEERDEGVSILVHTQDLGADLRGAVRLDAAGDTVTVSLDLRAATEFGTNRTGLVVLHPPRLAGAPLRVVHSDGSVDEATWPVRISPHQPALDIAGLAWRSGTHEIDVRFDGDVFEMEDQRNWTDASYKTYSRPLALPFPYRLEAGEAVRQSVRVTATVIPGAGDDPDDDTVRLGEAVTMPLLGVSAATAPDPAPVHTAEIPWETTLVELDLATPTWRAALARAARSGRPLDVRLITSDADPALIDTAATELAGLELARVTAFAASGAARHVSDAATIAVLQAALRDAGVTTFVVGGVRSHFTELNREHERIPPRLDGVVFSITPLFHSLTTAQLIESVAMQRLVAIQAVDIADGAAVHIGPISLRPHVNNVATTPPPASPHTDLRAGYGPALLDAADPRQDAAELAGWTVASAAALAVPGVASLTFFEEWGPRGVVRDDGSLRPVGDALAALADLQGRVVATGGTPDGLVWALAELESGDLLVANLDRRDRDIAIDSGNRRRVSCVVPAGSWRRVTAAN